MSNVNDAQDDNDTGETSQRWIICKKNDNEKYIL